MGNALQTRLASCGIGLANDPPAAALDFGRDWLPESRVFSVEAYRSATDTILSGCFAVFALNSVEQRWSGFFQVGGRACSITTELTDFMANWWEARHVRHRGICKPANHL